MLGGVVPGVAGLGPVEGGLVAGLMAFGVDLPTAAAVTALERAISYGFSTVGRRDRHRDARGRLGVARGAREVRRRAATATRRDPERPRR